MNRISSQRFDTALLFTYSLFIFGSTFSIALAQLSLGASLFLFLVIAIKDRHNPFVAALRPFYIVIAAYIGWLVIASLANHNPLESLIVIREVWLFAAVPIGIYLMQDEKYRRWLVSAFALGVLLVSCYALVQHFTGLNLFRSLLLPDAPDYGYRVQGGFSHRLAFGNYYATASLFCLGLALVQVHKQVGLNRGWFLLAGLVAMVATVLTYSRGPVAGMLVALLITGVILGRRFLGYAAAIVGVAMVTVLLMLPGLTGRFTETTVKDLGGVYEGGRVYIWKNSLKIIEDHPLFGVGPENFAEAYEQHLPENIPEIRKHGHAHNDFLHVAAVAGLPGLILFSTMWVVTLGYFWKGWRRREQHPGAGRYFGAALAASLSFVLGSLSEATFIDEEIRQMLMFVWAAGLWPLYKSQSKSINRPVDTMIGE